MALVAVGACYVDTILTSVSPKVLTKAPQAKTSAHKAIYRVPHYPGEDDKLRATSITRRRGGNCPNTLEVLQQLLSRDEPASRTPLNLIAVLPARASAASKQVRDAFEPRVSLGHCVYRDEFEEPASSYIIKSSGTGSRTIVNYNELPEMKVDEFVRIAGDLAKDAGWYHFEGRIPDVTLACIRHLREHYPHVRVSVEVEKPGREGLQELAREADVVFYSKGWAQANGYNSAEECIQKQSSLTQKAYCIPQATFMRSLTNQRSFLCCTWGQDGAAALEGSGTVLHSPAYTPEGFQVVEYVADRDAVMIEKPGLTHRSTIGAGDTFIAGMLYGLICKGKEWDLAQKLKMANRLAGTKVAQEGFSDLGRVLDV